MHGPYTRGHQNGLKLTEEGNDIFLLGQYSSSSKCFGSIALRIALGAVIVICFFSSCMILYLSARPTISVPLSVSAERDLYDYSIINKYVDPFDLSHANFIGQLQPSASDTPIALSSILSALSVAQMWIPNASRAMERVLIATALIDASWWQSKSFPLISAPPQGGYQWYLPNLDQVLATLSPVQNLSGQPYVYLLEWTMFGDDSCMTDEENKFDIRGVRHVVSMMETLGISNYFFVTAKDTCLSLIQRSFESSSIPAVSMQPVVSLFPGCNRHGSVRMFTVYEVLRRGYGVIVLDPDVILFRSIPTQDLKADVAFSTYNAPDINPLHIDSVLTQDNLNMGLMYVAPSLNAMRMFHRVLWRVMSDVHTTDVWLCDDQRAMRNWIQANLHWFDTVHLGKRSLKLRSATPRTLSIRFWEPSKYSTSIPFFLGLAGQERHNPVAMHMTSYNSRSEGKEWGLKFYNLWFGEESSYFSGKFLKLTFRPHQSMGQEMHALKIGLFIAQSTKRTLILNSFRCSNLPQPWVDHVYRDLNACDLNFHISWAKLAELFEIREPGLFSNPEFSRSLSKACLTDDRWISTVSSDSQHIALKSSDLYIRPQHPNTETESCFSLFQKYDIHSSIASSRGYPLDLSFSDGKGGESRYNVHDIIDRINSPPLQPIDLVVLDVADQDRILFGAQKETKVFQLFEQAFKDVIIDVNDF